MSAAVRRGEREEGRRIWRVARAASEANGKHCPKARSQSSKREAIHSRANGSLGPLEYEEVETLLRVVHGVKRVTSTEVVAGETIRAFGTVSTSRLSGALFADSGIDSRR
jgi:hypothetical protein